MAGEVAEEVLGVAFVVDAEVAEAFLEFFGEAALLDDEEAGGILLGGWAGGVGAGGTGGGEFEELGDRPINGGGNLGDFAAEESHFSGVIEVLGGVEESSVILVLGGGVLGLSGFDDDDGQEDAVGVEFVEHAKICLGVLNNEAINVGFLICDEAEEFSLLTKEMADVAIAP